MEGDKVLELEGVGETDREVLWVAEEEWIAESVPLTEEHTVGLRVGERVALTQTDTLPLEELDKEEDIELV